MSGIEYMGRHRKLLPGRLPRRWSYIGRHRRQEG